MIQNFTNLHQAENDSNTSSMKPAKRQKNKARKLFKYCFKLQASLTQIKPTINKEDLGF